MKLIQKLKIWKELKRLETKARETPSPSTFVDLGQVYINLGMHERTLQLAEEGLALFPHSDELRKLRKFAKKTQLNNRIKDLRSRLSKSPHPKLYRELAALYLELGDFDAVHGTCEECIRRFPDDDGAFLVLAKGRLTNFYRDLIAQDGLEAVRCLNEVIRLDAANLKAHRLLGEVLYRAGAMEQARYHLEIIRDAAPGDSEIAEMCERSASMGSSGKELETLFMDIEEKGVLPNAPIARGVTGKNLATNEEGIGSIRDALAHLAEIDGVRKAAYIKGSKALVKGEIRDGRDPFLRVSRVVAKAAQRTSRRMDIGNFSKGVVEGDYGHICICNYGEVVASVLCDANSDVEYVLAELQELVAGSLYLTGAGSE